MQNHFRSNTLELHNAFGIEVDLGYRVKISVIGSLDSNASPQLEEFDKVLRIVRERSQIENAPLVSLDPNPDGFLPISFLETGVKYSQSVCRIARYFSHRDFIDFIGKIQQAITAHTNVNSNFDTVEKVIEVFSIPPEVAAKIFEIADYGEIIHLGTPLEVLKDKITENQLAKINPIPIGTGFLVGGSHLLTNHHVIGSKEIAAQCVAQFNYVENAQGYIQKSIDYEFDPILFVTEPGLDYTLLQLKSGMFTRQAGYEFDWIQLIGDEESVKPGLDWVEFQGGSQQVDSAWASSKEAIQDLRGKGYIVMREVDAIVIWHPDGKYNQDAIKVIGVHMEDKKKSDADKSVSKSDPIKSETGDAVIIVQHPKGKQKQIVLSNNEIIKNGLYQGVLRYKAKSDYGSSGSPVFNAHWKLVALHHAAVLGVPESDKPVAQQGIRICRIIEDLRKKSFTNSKLRSFIQDFVITAEQLNYPPLTAVADLNGGVSGLKNGHFDCGNHESLDVSGAITCEAWVAKLNDENGIVFCRTDTSQENGTGYGVGYFKGKIVVQLRKFVNSNQHDVHIYETKQLAPQDKLWHHIAFTWSQSNKVQIYIDGDKQETNDVEKSCFSDKPEKNGKGPLKESLDKLDGPVWIGFWPKFGAYLEGTIAEVRLWKAARTQTEVRETIYQHLTCSYSENLIGCWRFEEDSASQTYVHNLASQDSGSIAPQIPNFSSPPNKVQPEFGLELNGKNDYIDCGSFLIKEAITFEAWVKSNGDQQAIIASQGGLWEEPGYCLWWENGKIRVEFQGDKKHINFDADMPIDSSWHHLAFTWSSDLPNICIYIDGNRFQDANSFDGPIGASAYNLCIGRNKEITFYYFNGSIAEVRLWNVARSQEQIQDTMSRMLSEQEVIGTINQQSVQLLGCWPLNEQAGNEASNLVNRDSQPGLVNGGSWLRIKSAIKYRQGDYGVPLGNVKWLKASECSASLPLPCGLKFNGKDDQVNCGNDPSLNVPNTITVEAWVKHQFGNRLIVSRGCHVKDGYSLCWHDGKIRVMLKSANQEAIVDTKENAPADRVWHHVAFTWDATSPEIFIYLDGRQQDCVVIEGQTKSIAYAGQTKSTALFTGSLADLTTDLVIGGTTEKERYSDVTIAEVRLWKVVRTQDEIKTNMTCRLSRRDTDWPDLLGYWRLDDGGANNAQARNLTSDSNHGEIKGAKWFPAPPSSATLIQSPTSTENPSIPTPSA